VDDPDEVRDLADGAQPCMVVARMDVAASVGDRLSAIDTCAPVKPSRRRCF
jgi:hypothetical protein